MIQEKRKNQKIKEEMRQSHFKVGDKQPVNYASTNMDNFA